MNTIIDYEAIANQLEARSAVGAYFLRIHTRGRKVGMRRTTWLTVRDKVASRMPAIDQSKAERVLHIFSELGLGRVLTRYSRQEIEWNPSLDIRRLGRCLMERSRQRKRLKEIEHLRKGPSVVCLMPSGSFDALLATGLAATMEIERLK